MSRRPTFFIPLFVLLAVLFIFPLTSFAQDIRPQSIIVGGIQQGNWFEQWNQTGTMYCPNRQRFVTASNEAFTLSATQGEETLAVAYQTSRQTVYLARTSFGSYVSTNVSNQWVYLMEATVVSFNQISVTSKFYSRDGSCTLTNYATWTFQGAPQPPTQPPTNPQTCTVRANGVTVNKRIGPGVNYQIIGRLSPSTVATVISVGYDNQGGRWWFLSDNTWVSAAYTIATGPCPQ